MALSLLSPTVFAQDVSSAAEADSDASDVIIVTGTRREENLLDVPYNISAVSGEELKDRFIEDFNSVATAVPGLQASRRGVRAEGTNNRFIIRGVNASASGVAAFQDLINASVSTYIDETPIFANLQLNDIERVEVLRGPQGTLYGASSVGGTIRIIHNKPQTDSFEYRVSSSVATVKASDEVEWGADLVVNVPVSDRFALRVSAGYDQIAGFIDSTQSVVVDANRVPILADPSDPVGSGFLTEVIEDSDSAETWFVRATALLDVSDNFEVLLGYHHQDQQSDGFSNQSLGAERYELQTRIGYVPSDRKLDLFTATGTIDLGFATLTSASAYYETDEEAIGDITAVPLAFIDYYGGYPRATLPGFQTNGVESFTQELRLVSNGDGPFRWIFGGFFQDRESYATDDELLKGYSAWSQLPGTGIFGFSTWGDVQEYLGLLRAEDYVPEDLTYRFDRATTFQDIAIFGELSYDITDRWQVTGGARVFWQEFSQDLLVEVPGFGPAVAADGNIFGRNQDFSEEDFQDQVFKVNTSYDVTDDTLVYFTWAQGFRPGGGNSYPIGDCPFCDGPEFLTFEPDSATNYEAGVKGTLGNAFRYSAALFRIQWDAVQIETAAASTNPIIVNGDTARTQGIEFESFWSPIPDLNISTGYAYVDAELTSDFTVGTVTGVAGTPLPGVSAHTASAALNYRIPLRGDRAILFNADGYYRSSAASQRNTAGEELLNFDGYAMFNGSLGFELNDRISAQIFVTNITNELGVTGRVSGGFVEAAAGYPRESVQRPRTIGFRINLSN